MNKQIKRKVISLLLFFSVVLSFFSPFADLFALPASATGSDMLTSNDGYRPYLEYYTRGSNATTAGISRKTILNVYLNAGETLCLGSSVSESLLDASDALKASPTGCDIIVTNPGGNITSLDVTSSSGLISSVEAEAAGPNVAGVTTGYTPLTYTASVTGVYKVVFHSVNGNSDNPAPVLTTDNSWDGKGGCVAAWDACVVKDYGTADEKTVHGRTYTKCLCLNMGTNAVSTGEFAGLYSEVYVVTSDGYIYKTNFNGCSPYGFVFFADNRGLVSTDSNYSLYKSYVSNNNSLSDLKAQGVTFQNPWKDDTALDKTFSIFFEKPDPELEGVLFPTAYEPEVAKNISFIGSVSGSTTSYNYGGYFKFDVTVATSATVLIDLTSVNPDYGVVRLSNPVTPGTNYFYWDGHAANGVPVPVGTYDNNKIKINVETHSGEYHFPLFDVETAPNGFEVTRVNRIYNEKVDSNGNIYREDVTQLFESGKSIIYYDNHSRLSATGYHNTSHTIADCFDATAPTPALPEGGIDSAGGAMSYSGTASSYHGDQTALDIWTYSNNNGDASVTLDTPITIVDEAYTTINGRVFFDNSYSSLTSTENYFDLGDGDFTYEGLPVNLTYTYTNPTDPLNPVVVNLSAVTDAEGRYNFNGIPLMTDGSGTAFSVTVTLPAPSYVVTTEYTSTNSSDTTITPTNGTLVQSGTVFGYTSTGERLNTLPVYLSDIGVNYKKLDKSITVIKDWVVDISADPSRPVNVTVKLNAYYYSSGVKTFVKSTTIVLDNTNAWQKSLSYLPKYYNLGNKDPLIYELYSEEYTLRGETTPYVFTLADTGAFPYNTTFSIADTIATTEMIVRNSPDTATIQLTKRDYNDSSVLIEGVSFVLWEKTALTSIPAENPDNYRFFGSDVYIKKQTKASNNNGIVTFTGLNTSKYFAVETVSAAGYVLDTKSYGFDLTGTDINAEATVYNKRTPSKIDVNKVVTSAINGVTVPITIEYASDSKFTQNLVKRDLSVTTVDGELSYSAVNDFEVPWGFFVRVSEGASSYTLLASSSNVYDDTAAQTLLSTYNSGDYFETLAGHDYTVTLTNALLNSKLSVVKTVDVCMPDCTVPIIVTTADDAAFTQNVRTVNCSVTIQSGKLSYDVLTDLAIHDNSYVKITEGGCSYAIDPSASGVYDNTTASDFLTSYNSGEVFRASLGHSYTVTLSNKAQSIETFYFQKLWLDSSGNILDEAACNTNGRSASQTSAFSDVSFTLERSTDGIHWSAVTKKSSGGSTISNVATSDYIISKNKSNVGITSMTKGTLIWTKRLGKQYWNLPKYDNTGQEYVYRGVETPVAGYTQYVGQITYTNKTDSSGKTYTEASFLNPVTGASTVFNTYAGGEVYKQNFQSNYLFINYPDTVISKTMSIHKVDGATDNPLAGAEFTLYSDSACSTPIAVSSTAVDDYGNVTNATFSSLIPNTTYYLKETAAPSGYQLPADYKNVIIAADGSVTVDGAPVAVLDNTFTLTIANYLGVSMPQSGVTNTSLLFMIIGLAVCLLAIIMAIRYKLKQMGSRRRI